MATNSTETPVLSTENTVAAAPPPEPARKRRSLTWFWLLVFAAAAFGGYRVYQNLHQAKQNSVARDKKASGPRSVPVSGATARTGDLPVYLRGLGSVTPYNNVVVKSRVDGQLMSINYQEGQFVKKGDLLAQIDPRPFEVQKQQAEGQLARDVAQLNDAKVNLARYESLWKQQIIAKQQYDTQAASVGNFEGAITADKAAINNADLQLTYARITAPISGRIGLRQVDVGNIVHAADQSGIATIAQMQPIAVLFTIPADDLQSVLRKMRAGGKLPVFAYDREDANRIATGTLLTVDNQIDPQTGTSRLKSEFANGDLSLFPNQFVNCRLLLDTRRALTLVPAQAIQRGPQGAFVFVADNGVAHMRPVNVIMTEAGDTAVDGVKAGETVVTDGQDKLMDGAKVDIRPAGGARGRQGGPGAPGAGAQGGGQGDRRGAAGSTVPATDTGSGPNTSGSPRMGPGAQFTPGPGAPGNPGKQYGPAPSRGPGQGGPWKGPGEGGRRPEK